MRLPKHRMPLNRPAVGIALAPHLAVRKN
jgi:hypothetical protein